ncbi:TPA: hypothetical protein N0F65_003346 [Lagenidium giganteum]|uniref:Uncharacterized protein n=1 Tax=Lagenidium giganteum TaxID=4803 RepID=A0AAV2ZAP1_9STRA|nr:TPA: hypothetical protein N0F65_003346 [Lagenidium giganteum]
MAQPNAPYFECIMSVEQEAQAFVDAEGTVTFAQVPDERFRYVLTSDKIETRLELQSLKSKQKWEVRANDEEARAFGPQGMELRRQVVATFLKVSFVIWQSHLGDTLAGTDSIHTLALHPRDRAYVLKLTLKFSPVFSPVYSFEMQPLVVQMEDILRGFIHDLQLEVAELKSNVTQLNNKLKVQETTAATDKQQLADEIAALREELQREKASTATTTAPAVTGSGFASFAAAAPKPAGAPTGFSFAASR